MEEIKYTGFGGFQKLYLLIKLITSFKCFLNFSKSFPNIILLDSVISIFFTMIR